MQLKCKTWTMLSLKTKLRHKPFPWKTKVKIRPWQASVSSSRPSRKTWKSKRSWPRITRRLISLDQRVMMLTNHSTIVCLWQLSIQDRSVVKPTWTASLCGRSNRRLELFQGTICHRHSQLMVNELNNKSSRFDQRAANVFANRLKKTCKRKISTSKWCKRKRMVSSVIERLS